MKLTIFYFPDMPDRKRLIKREGGTYDQHAHMKTKRDCIICRNLIDAGKYPRNKKYRYAVQRLLTEEEFKKLDKKDRYINQQQRRG